jgi:hypothetical protein
MAFLKGDTATLAAQSVNDLVDEDFLTEISHILPGTLYPAVANIMVDGSTALSATTVGPNASTVTSSKYGTVQSDGRMYYYTDIKGSKPIKDPRIGAHFGSQRHKMKSIQLLEQETATHGDDVYSVDGREWMRFCGNAAILNSSFGGNLVIFSGADADAFIEIVGYFSDVNYIGLAYTLQRYFQKSVDGGSETLDTAMRTGAVSPLLNRYVDAGAVHNLGLGQTLGIHTLKIRNSDSGTTEQSLYSWGIELIAQDTTDTASKSKIQIPAQTVVSQGVKSDVSATATHYNPFAFAGDGTTAVAIGDTTSHGKVATGWTGSTSAYFDSTLDTATSLGLSAWETGGDFYRPVNGGRVVRWVDSSGSIKTSVNMMPPCATAITDASGSDASLPTSHAWTTVYQPKIKSGAIDHSQAEVAKTFHYREFGNGGANGNASYKDVSVKPLENTDQDTAYVMDDGLTSFSGSAYTVATGNMDWGASDIWYWTFIGTGFSWINFTTGRTLVQNLPYGTHIVKFQMNGSSPWIVTITVDGVSFTASAAYMNIKDITFHQPKMPPIPEDAVVIADYMLMADFVPQTTAGGGVISKGVRYINSSRDVFYDSSGALTGTSHGLTGLSQWGIVGTECNSSGITATFPCFATNAVVNSQSTDSAGYSVDFGGSTGVDTTHRNAIYNPDDSLTLDDSITLAQTNLVLNMTSALNGQRVMGFQVATPIHTSSHYQTFETPFLHELVGGDRNMEQNNLVVSPDGKTWDEVTRNTSYMGPSASLRGSRDGGTIAAGNIYIYDYWRGQSTTSDAGHFHNKGFAIAYDKIICLETAQYRIEVTQIFAGDGGDNVLYLRVNSTEQNIRSSFSGTTSGGNMVYLGTTLFLNRGDYVQMYFAVGNLYGAAEEYGAINIYKID